MSRVGRIAPWLVMAASLLPVGASAQNLDAGKPPTQIFSEVCANCHRSARELKSNAGASFLREHYTTGSDMASTMAAYLASVGSSGSSGSAQPKRQPGAGAAASAAPGVREGPPARVPPQTEPKPAESKPAESKPAEPKQLPGQAANRNRPGTARGDAGKPATEAKPVAAGSSRPVLEDFEE